VKRADLGDVAAGDGARLARFKGEILVGAVADQKVVAAAGVVLDEHGGADLAAESGGAGGGVEGGGNGVASGGEHGGGLLGLGGGGAAFVFPAVDIEVGHRVGSGGVGRAWRWL